MLVKSWLINTSHYTHLFITFLKGYIGTFKKEQVTCPELNVIKRGYLYLASHSTYNIFFLWTEVKLFKLKGS